MIRAPRPRLPGRPRGMTTMEMLVVLALFAVIAGALMTSYLTSSRAFTSADASVYVQQQARQAMGEMTRELRQAGGAVVVGASQLTVQQDLGYDLAAPCPANAVCWGARDQAGNVQFGWSSRFRLNGSQLVLEILDAAVPPAVQGTRVLANDVSQLTFTYVAATRTVTIQLQVRRTSSGLAGGSITAAPTPLVTSIRLRNP